MDIGLVFCDDAPLYGLAADTDQVPEVMPDGLPGYAAVYATIARMSRACWDRLADRTGQLGRRAAEHRGRAVPQERPPVDATTPTA